MMHSFTFKLLSVPSYAFGSKYKQEHFWFARTHPTQLLSLPIYPYIIPICTFIRRQKLYIELTSNYQFQKIPNFFPEQFDHRLRMNSFCRCYRSLINLEFESINVHLLDTLKTPFLNIYYTTNNIK